MRALLLAGTALLALGSAGWAQADNVAGQGQASSHLRSNLTQMLQQEGYSKIRVAPTSFMVHAKDTDGNAVVMSIGPDTFAEVTNVGDTNGSAGGQTSTGASAANAGSTYVTVPSTDELGSKVVGLDVYNDSKQDIGTIKDIALNPSGGVAAYVLSVGGFLGIGDHYVAVSPRAVKLSYDANSKKWTASMNATADQIKAAPEFQYTGRWSKT